MFVEQRIIGDRPVVRPSGIYYGVLEDGCYHYGLLFDLTSDFINGAPTAIGTVTSSGCPFYRLKPPELSPTGKLVRYVPRKWLILTGYLPIRVALSPSRRFPIRNLDKLLRSSWAELVTLDSQPRAKEFRRNVG